jgi:mitotic spindle assembly checkpoint protein MAD1
LDTGLQEPPHEQSWKLKCGLLDSKLEGLSRENNQLRELLSDVEQRASHGNSHGTGESTSSTNIAEERGEQQEDLLSTPGKPVTGVSSNLSPAPLAIMTELNGTRIKLAQAKTENRQLSRQVKELSRKAQLVTEQREVAKRAQHRCEKLELENKSLRKDHDSHLAHKRQWDSFRREIDQTFSDTNGPSNNNNTDNSHPPEIATVLRHVKALKQHISRIKKERSGLQGNLDSSNRHISVLEQQAKEDGSAVQKYQIEIKELRTKMEASEDALRRVQAQEIIVQREADNLRDLLKTYEQKESQLSSMRGSESKNPGDTEMHESPTVKGLQVSLESTRDQLKVLTEQHKTLTEEVDPLRKQLKDMETEHERVKKKFGLLRDALMVERAKAERAEEQAHEAERLAGKGSFNTDTTRVLHLGSNPLSQAIREKYEAEIKILQRSLANSGSNQQSADAALDAEKSIARLKEFFREQSAKFREAVYQITGCKIEMIPEGPDEKGRFKVRSMYGEREEDHLLFRWAGNSKTIDLMSSDQAEKLFKTDVGLYITKFKSIPGFVSSLTLQLLENQTMLG